MSGPINTDRIGFFFGAGSSIEFGIPSMKQMTSSFADEIRKRQDMKEENEVFEVFDLIYNSLKKLYGKGVDLEAIMSVIVGLKEKEHIRENIGELGLFVLENNGIQDLSIREYKTQTLEELETEFKKYVRSKVAITNPQKIDLLRKILSDFFGQICARANCSPGEAPYSNTASKWTFFTTNYDNVLEDFWVNHHKYHYLDLGFRDKNRKRIMDPERFVQVNSHKSEAAMQLVKLHGSINWVRTPNGDIEEREYHQSYDEVRARSGSTDFKEDVIIYPLSQKQLYFTPFIQLFRILNAELVKRELWIIVGYSFRDIIIRNMFERALAENNHCKILLVHPHATKQIKPIFRGEVRDQITCLDMYFARENYDQVNRNIAEVLATLA